MFISLLIMIASQLKEMDDEMQERQVIHLFQSVVKSITYTLKNYTTVTKYYAFLVGPHQFYLR
jgi:hypothetical protein